MARAPSIPTSPASPSLLDRLTSPQRLNGLRDAQGRSLLMAAIEEDDLEMVEFLAPRSDLFEQVRVAGKNAPLRTPLMLAAHLGRTACVRALLQHQPEKQCAQGHPEGPLFAVDQAVNAGHADCVALLAPWSNLANRRRLHPMVRAAVMGRPDLVKALLPHAPLNARDDYLRNALGGAVSESERSPGRDECVRLLLEQPGIEVKIPGKDDYDTPTYMVLFNAITYHQPNALRLLLPHFDVNVLRNSPSVNTWNGTRTALHVAITARDVDAVKMLLPLSDAAFGLRQTVPSNSYREENNTTPAELVLARLLHSGASDWKDAIAVADLVLAHCVRQGLPAPMPPFETQYQDPMSEAQKRQHWPQLFNALESVELERALATDDALAGVPAKAPRHRL